MYKKKNRLNRVNQQIILFISILILPLVVNAEDLQEFRVPNNRVYYETNRTPIDPEGFNIEKRLFHIAGHDFSFRFQFLTSFEVNEETNIAQFQASIISDIDFNTGYSVIWKMRRIVKADGTALGNGVRLDQPELYGSRAGAIYDTPANNDFGIPSKTEFFDLGEQYTQLEATLTGFGDLENRVIDMWDVSKVGAKPLTMYHLDKERLILSAWLQGRDRTTGEELPDGSELIIDLVYQRSTPVNPGILGGLVWEDTNANGLQDDGEPGMDQIPVFLFDKDGTELAVGIDPDTRVGQYLFDYLTDGEYSVCFDLRSVAASHELTIANVGDDDLRDSDVDGTNANCTPLITVTRGQTDESWDLGLRRLPLASRLSGRVWRDFGREGINTGYPAVEDVGVHLYDESWSWLMEDNTDENGGFNFWLQAGKYFVCFDSNTFPENYELTSQNRGDDEERDSDANPSNGCTDLITVLPDTHSESHDAGLRPFMPGILGDRVWIDSNQDGIQQAEEEGLEGIGVHLYDESWNWLQGVYTSSLGKYLFEMEAGNFYICFEPGTYPHPEKLRLTLPNVGDDLFDSDVLHSGCTDLIHINLNEENLSIDAGAYFFQSQPGILGDKVWLDSNKDGIQQAEEEGLEGIGVHLYDESWNWLREVYTTSSGKYLFEVEAGNYYLCFEPGTYPQPDKLRLTLPNVGNDLFDSDALYSGCTEVINMSANTDNSSIDVGAYFFQSQPGKLGDKVWLDSNKDGIQQAEEEGLESMRVHLFDGSWNWLKEVYTTNTGHYIFDTEPGSYFICFEAASYPERLAFTTVDVGDDNFDSDANSIHNACTDLINLPPNTIDLSYDAGFFILR